MTMIPASPAVPVAISVLLKDMHNNMTAQRIFMPYSITKSIGTILKDCDCCLITFMYYE